MTAASDVQRLVEAATGLDIRPRARRWAHLPVCVLDAVFSINARYTSTISVCDRYAKHQGLVPHLVDVADFATVAGTTAEQPVDALAELGRRLGPDRFAAEVLENRGRTSTRGGVLKADAAVRYAEVLADSGVHTLGDVTTLLSDLSRLDAVERQLRAVPGNGGHDVRLGYLWMLAGNDEQVKPDRKVLRWLSRHLGHEVDVPAARRLLAEAAAELDRTPWELDHAIWKAA
ncbi:hypothetical protein Amsp01_106080 [Amycolatopsis sp. NBRC 101858]|uniref:hypothetical protein n=1 Tax=Amycolatopsis sp. NBRC 101858 TaxID=3032200 RepID=UPI00249FF1C5|nr:hypothetical protein [Amycolatopsis sp. NBRC 101858]GLY44585.1 hypothetical protein Amsp01_106080 [Amycolatopsis sp. NBRC 101858]